MCWKETIAIGTSGHLRLCPPNFVQSWVAIDCIILTILESHRSADYWCTWRRIFICIYLVSSPQTSVTLSSSFWLHQFLGSERPFLRILLRTMQVKQTTHAKRTAAMLGLLEDVGQRLGMIKVELVASINFCIFCLINQSMISLKTGTIFDWVIYGLEACLPLSRAANLSISWSSNTQILRGITLGFHCRVGKAKPICWIL